MRLKIKLVSVFGYDYQCEINTIQYKLKVLLLRKRMAISINSLTEE